MLNKYDHQYDATPSTPTVKPTKGTDPLTGRHTLSFDGAQYLTCPMNWNTISEAANDNLQVFIVFRFTTLSGLGELRDGRV